MWPETMSRKRPCSAVDLETSHQYIKKLKETINPDDFEQFKLSLKEYKTGKICQSELLRIMHDSVGRDHGLLTGVNLFLPGDYKIKPNYGQYNWFSVKKASVDFFNNVRLAYKHDNDTTYKSFLKIMERVVESEEKNMVIDRNRVFEEVDVLFKDHPEFSIEFTKLFTNGSGQTSQRVRCTDFKKKEHSPEEEKVFDMEDLLYEKDMLKHYYESAIKQSEEFLSKYSNTRERDVPRGIVYEYLSLQDIRVIKKTYGDRGDELEDYLKRKPVCTLTKIVPRLRQKHEELERYPEDLKRKCQKVFGRVSKCSKVDEIGRKGKAAVEEESGGVVVDRRSVSSEKSGNQSPVLQEGGARRREEGWRRSGGYEAVGSVVAPRSSRTDSAEESSNSDSTSE